MPTQLQRPAGECAVIAAGQVTDAQTPGACRVLSVERTQGTSWAVTAAERCPATVNRRRRLIIQDRTGKVVATATYAAEELHGRTRRADQHCFQIAVISMI